MNCKENNYSIYEGIEPAVIFGMQIFRFYMHSQFLVWLLRENQAPQYSSKKKDVYVHLAW